MSTTKPIEAWAVRYESRFEPGEGWTDEDVDLYLYEDVARIDADSWQSSRDYRNVSEPIKLVEERLLIEARELAAHYRNKYVGAWNSEVATSRAQEEKKWKENTLPWEKDGEG